MRVFLAVVIIFAPVSALAGPALELDLGEVDIFAMRKGLVAPFSGLLVPEDRFKEFIEAEIRVEELEGEVKLEKRLRLTQEEIYTDALKETTKPKTWWESPETQRWVGFGLGVVAASAAIYGGAQLVKASQ